MITINNETAAIEIKETFSFDGNVGSFFDNIFNDVESAYLCDEIEDEEVRKNVKKFIDHKLTTADKVAILNNILENYQYEQYRNQDGYNISIFDEEFIDKAINDWVEETFGFRPDEMI
jgi:hypothetical protein